MPDAVGLAFDATKGFHATPVIVTDSLCWNELQTTDFLDDKPQYNPETGEKQGVILQFWRLTVKLVIKNNVSS